MWAGPMKPTPTTPTLNFFAMKSLLSWFKNNRPSKTIAQLCVRPRMLANEHPAAAAVIIGVPQGRRFGTGSGTAVSLYYTGKYIISHQKINKC
jgi:hypothetical protein